MARRITAWQVTGRGNQSAEDERLARLFVTALSRVPEKVEVEAMRELLNIERKLIAASPKSVAGIAGKQPVPQGVSQAEIAAWTVVCRTLMNLDEFITRD